MPVIQVPVRERPRYSPLVVYTTACVVVDKELQTVYHDGKPSFVRPDAMEEEALTWNDIRLIPWHSILRVHSYETTMWTLIFDEKVQLTGRGGI